MCGIHGFINTKKKENNADDFVTSGFVAGSLRGSDSSGIAVIGVADKTIDFQKLPIMGPMFIQDKYAKSLMVAARTAETFTICHTRAMTTGKVGYNEAHPFYVNADTRELIGVHNGTLTGWNYRSGANKFSVDSEWALNMIFDKGLEAFKEFNGPYCFVWWDSDDSETLNFALNKDRPMCIAFTEDGNMAYASEAGMIKWLCDRHSIKIKGAILYLIPDKWYKFPVADPSKFTRTDLPSYVSTYTAPAPVTHTPYTTVMDRVTTLLDKIASATPKPALKLAHESRKPMVSADEVQNARDLQYLGTRVTFIPYWTDGDNEVTGDVQIDNSELEGIIRNAGELEYKTGTEWACTVIGVFDDGKDMKLICSKPTLIIKEGSDPILSSAAIN